MASLPTPANLPLRGLLAIGDPHLAHRPPGHRTDDFTEQAFDKLAWCLAEARREHLLPVLLGDFFHWPRDNSNALLVRALDLLLGSGLAPIAAVPGNHDMRFGTLEPEDSLSVLVGAGALDLLDRRPPAAPRRETIGGRTVVLGGTAWGAALPRGPGDASAVTRAAAGMEVLVVWLTHHDLVFPGSEDVGRGAPPELPGVDVALNGHIHRPTREPVVAGSTTWFNPGNITRLTRSAATRDRRPSVLRLLVEEATWRVEWQEVPHLPFEAVFHDPGRVDEPEVEDPESAFVRGLEQLVARRTSSGQGLRDYLEANLGAHPPDVAAEVRELAEVVLRDEGPPTPGA